jgi:arginase
MNIRLLYVPYDLGRPRRGIGSGPLRFREAGAAGRLRALGHCVREHRIRRPHAFTNELKAVMEVNAAVAEQVREALAVGDFPLVLAGDCNSCLGTLAALDGAAAGVIWFDAHGDFNTPETTASGFFDGMALAAVTGRCWLNLVRSALDFHPLADDRVVLAGVRDLDPLEGPELRSSGVRFLPAERLISAGAGPALEEATAGLQSLVRRLYLHIDLDVLDPAEAPANAWSVGGGITVAQLEESIGWIRQRFPVGAAALTAYDPECDPEGRTLEAGLRILERVTSPGSSSTAATGSS